MKWGVDGGWGPVGVYLKYNPEADVRSRLDREERGPSEAAVQAASEVRHAR